MIRFVERERERELGIVLCIHMHVLKNDVCRYSCCKCLLAARSWVLWPKFMPKMVMSLLW